MMHHVHFNTSALLKMRDRKLESLFCEPQTGKPLPAAEIRDILRADISKGHMYFCTCDNRKPNGSCAGHTEKSTESRQA